MTRKKDDLLAPKHIIYTSGIDSYVNPGFKINQLALIANQRELFFEQRPNLAALLKRGANNPLVEEGNYQTPVVRSYQGEYYLNHEAITLLVEREIRTHQPKKNGLKYNSKNIYILKNDMDNFGHILKNLELNDGQDAKFIYIDGIHSIPLYVRNVEGTIRCFIVDPESYNFGAKIKKLILSIFPSAKIVSSTTVLQKDYYSCSTFAIKALMYFVKHGSEIFPYIDNLNNKKRKRDDSGEMMPEQLMPALLKMIQARLNLSEQCLSTIVSNKQQLSLKEYFIKYAINLDQKSYNSAALVKKYKYFDKIHQYLTAVDVEPISVDSSISLPPTLNQRHEKYAQLPAVNIKKHSVNPVSVYRNIVAFFDGEGLIKDKATNSVFEAIKAKFPQFERLYKAEFVEDSSPSNPVTKFLFVAAFAEKQDLSYLDLYKKFAKKLNKFFENPEDVFAYLTKFVQINNKQAIHDLCTFEIPKLKNTWNKRFWIQLILKYGPAITKYLTLAPHIETLIRENSGPDVNIDLEYIYYLLENHQYRGAELHKELASLCIRHLRLQEEFDECLKLVLPGLKKYDFLPEITISLAQIDKRLAKYTFQKLPITDLRGLFLGEYTLCCQSMNKHGEYCAVHGMTSPLSGFYVVCDNDIIIAESWVWIGNNGQVVFDSWEFINKSQAYMCKPIITKAAQAFIEAGFSRVLIGTGGHTPDMGLAKVTDPVPFMNPKGYSDAIEQYLVKDSLLDLSARFANFASKNMLTYSKFTSLLQLTKSEIVVALTRLIDDGTLSVAEFSLLVEFFYINHIDFLHQASPKLPTLIVTAFKAYGDFVKHLLTFINHNSKQVIEVLISYDEPSFLAELTNFIEFHQLNFMVQSCIKQNAIKDLKLLLAVNSERFPQDSLAAMLIDGQPLLLTALKNNALDCAEYMLSKIKDKEVLSDLLAIEKRSQYDSIFHLLAQLQALNCFKYIEALLSEDELYVLLRENSNYDLKSEVRCNVLLTAFYSGAKQLVLHLLNQNYGFTMADLLTADVEINLIRSNNLESLRLLREITINESDWLQLLVTEKLHSNLLNMALYTERYELALFIIESLNEKQNILKLIDSGKNDYSPIYSIKKTIPPEILAVLIRKLLVVFKENKKELLHYFIATGSTLFQVISFTRNGDLLREVFHFFSEDSALFAEMLNFDDSRNLLSGCLNRVSFSGISVEMSIEYLDILFSFSSIEQQIKLIEKINFWHASSELIEHLLTIIDSYGAQKFNKSLISFDENGLLFRSFSHPELHISMLEYYLQYYSVEHINDHLVQSMDFVANGLSYDHIVLLKQIYPIIRHHSDNLTQIFGMLDVNSINCLTWLLDQKEITDTMLLEAFSAKSRKQALKVKDKLTETVFGTAGLYWRACCNRFSKQKLHDLVFENFDSMYLMIINALFESTPSYRTKKIVIEMLVSMLQIVKDHPDYLSLFTKKNENEDTVFKYCYGIRCFDFIKLLLINCTKTQRVNLVEKFIKTLPVTPKMDDFIAALEQLDVLLAFKSDLLLAMQVKSTTTFFQEADKDAQEVLTLLNPFKADELYYYDKDNKLQFVSETDINSCWNKLNNLLKMVVQKKDNQFQDLYYKYQDHMEELKPSSIMVAYKP
ncbi:MAG: hypothetical protein WC627_08320 [Legionella sp.]|jgi:hypothetical protein